MSFSDFYNIHSPKARMAQVGQALDALSLGATFNAGTTGGSGNTFTATISPAPTAYFDGMLVVVKADRANTGASTLNVNSIGAKNIYKEDGTIALTGAEMLILGAYLLRYDSALNASAGGWLIMNPQPARTSWTPTITGSGTITISNTVVDEASYERIGGMYAIRLSLGFQITGAGAQLYVSLPFSVATDDVDCEFLWGGRENATELSHRGAWFCDTTTRIRFIKRLEASNFTAGAGARISMQGFVKAA